MDDARWAAWWARDHAGPWSRAYRRKRPHLPRWVGLQRVGISIWVAPSHQRTTGSGRNPSDPGANQQGADRHDHKREPTGILLLVRLEHAAENDQTSEDLEHGTADAERTESQCHDLTLSHCVTAHAAMSAAAHNGWKDADVVTRRPTAREASWINVLIVGVGNLVMGFGSSYLTTRVDHFGFVLAYIALVTAIMIALVVYVTRVSRPE
jgi:hypothetical protein